MRRLAAAVILLLLILVPAPPAAADGATAAWDADRVIDSTVTFYENDTLTIEAGVNISFEPGAGGPSATRPMLAMMGALFVNGTAERPVRISANESMWLDDEGPFCLSIFNDDRADRLRVCNASLTDLAIGVYYSGGEFRDCVFERCDLYAIDSSLSFLNCTFIYSTVGFGQYGQFGSLRGRLVFAGCRFDGRDPASHPPLSAPGGIFVGDRYPRTAIGTGEAVVMEDCHIRGYDLGISANLNSSSIQDSTVIDCGQGILLEGQLPKETADIRGCTVQNCTSFGVFALGALRLSDSVIGDCGESGIYSYGDLLLANCTIYGCPTGLSLYAGSSASAPDWLLSGNRIFGCSEYAIRAEGMAVETGGNRFEDGNLTNGLGRLLVSKRVQLAVVDPAGRLLTGTSELEWTDALGGTGSQLLFPEDTVLFNDHFIANNGSRGDLFPYSLLVRRGTLENRTVLAASQNRLSLVLPVFPDLVALHLEPDADIISSGQEVRFLVRLENSGAGPAGESTVAFLVDGKVVDRQPVAPLALRGRASVYSDAWYARPGRHTLEARLDEREQLVETNETNNNITMEFQVGSAGAAGASVSPVAVLVVAIVVMIIFLLVYLRSLGRRTDGPEPALATPAPAPQAPAPPTTAPAPEKPGTRRIKCPKCGTEMDVASPVRPLEIKCETCGSRLRLAK